MSKKIILHPFSLEEFEQIEAEMKKASISCKEFTQLADRAIEHGLIHCCAPYWVKDERIYIVKSNLSGKTLLMSEPEAAFYLLGLLEGYGKDTISEPSSPN